MTHRIQNGLALTAVLAMGLILFLQHQSKERLKSERDAIQQQLAEATKSLERFARVEDQEKQATGTAVFLGQAKGDAQSRLVARVLSIPPVPDPQTSPYKDCLAELEIEPVSWGDQTGGARRIGMISVFRDRVLSKEAGLRVGDIIHCATISPSDLAPEITKQRRVSVVEDLSLDTVYLGAVTRMGFGEAIHVPVKSDPTPLSSADAIKQDLARIDALRQRNGGDWAAWHEKLQPFRDQLKKGLVDAGGTLTREERFTFRYLAQIERRPGPSWPAPQIQALQSLKAQLAKRSIDLLVVPVPAKEVATWPFLVEGSPPDRILMPYRLFLHQELLKAGIEILDLGPELVSAWEHVPQVYYDGIDSHPADGAIQVAAELVSERLQRYGLTPMVTETWHLQDRFSIPASSRSFPESAKSADRYTATRIYISDYTGVRDAGVRKAPVLLLSDSYGGVPIDYGARNANFVAHLSARLGMPIRHLQVGGGGPQMLKHLAKAGPDFLTDCSVCVFLLAEDYLFQHNPDLPELRWDLAEIP